MGSQRSRGFAVLVLALAWSSTAGHTTPPAERPPTEAIALQRRAVAAAEASSKAAQRSAEAALRNARVAESQVLWARAGVLIASLALFGPYLILLGQRALNRRGARTAAQSAVEASSLACRRARDSHAGKSRSDGEVWADLTALSVTRNVVDVELRRAEAGHELLLELSGAYQTNFAIRDALQMRLTEAKPRNLGLSDQILAGLEDRLAQSSR